MSRLLQGYTNYSVGSRAVHVVNPYDSIWRGKRWVLWFGAYGDLMLLVWANHLETALDIAGDWLADYAPGIFADDSEDDTDMTYVCSGNHQIPSWEWGIAAENPTRAELLSMMGRSEWSRGGRQ